MIDFLSFNKQCPTWIFLNFSIYSLFKFRDEINWTFRNDNLTKSHKWKIFFLERLLSKQIIEFWINVHFQNFYWFHPICTFSKLFFNQSDKKELSNQRHSQVVIYIAYKLSTFLMVGVCSRNILHNWMLWYLMKWLSLLYLIFVFC